MSVRRLLPIMALAVFTPAAAHAFAGTIFYGSVSLSFAVHLNTPINTNQTVYCQVDMQGTDSGAEVFKAHRLIAATEKSTTFYECPVLLPYYFVNDYYGGNNSLYPTVTYQAIVYDTTAPLTVPGAEYSSGTVVFQASTTGTVYKYSTETRLY